jgi:hypothetical protein
MAVCEYVRCAWKRGTSPLSMLTLQCSLPSEGHSAKSPELWRAGNWLLHDDNAPSHRAVVMREFLAHNSITTHLHPPYSPDLAP